MRAISPLLLTIVVAITAILLTDPAGSMAQTTSAPTPGHAAPDAFDEPWPTGIPQPARAMPDEVTPDVLAEAIIVAHDFDPTLAAKLAELRDRDPAVAIERLSRMSRMLNLVQLKRTDANLYTLKLTELRVDREVSRLGRAIRTAKMSGEQARAEQLTTQLTGNLILQISFRHREREEYLCLLQETVAALEGRLRAERGGLDGQLEKRMAELTRAGTPPPSPTPDVVQTGSPGTPRTGGPRGAPKPPMGAKLTEDDVDLAIEVARDLDRERDGDLAAQLLAMRKADPVDLARRLQGMTLLRGLIELRRREPHLYKLKVVELTNDAKVERLAASLRAAHREGRSADEDRLYTELRNAVILQLSFTFLSRQEYVRHLQEHVRLLQEEIDAAERGGLDANLAARIEELTTPPTRRDPRLGPDE